MIAAYVEQHIEREALVARPVFEMISEHLGQCSGCMEVFKSLRDIYRLEKAGLLADMEDFLNTNTPLPLTDNPSEST
ncbi:MAG: hypothetical protein EXR62_11785 [Chloroflexi bacterium]|nr:hypothetical protein [Chloroflexota bacterium]